MEKHLVDMSELSNMLSISQNTLRNDIIKRDDFPKAITIGPRMRRWKVSDIMEWMDSLKEESN